jgi:hypothetical protein
MPGDSSALRATNDFQPSGTVQLDETSRALRLVSLPELTDQRDVIYEPS